MSAFDRVIQGLMQMQRAMRWATLGAIGLVLFLLWSEFIEPVTSKWNNQADAIEAEVQNIRSVDRSVRQFSASQPLITAIGPVRPPQSVAEGSKQFTDLVNDVGQRNGATNYTFSWRSRGKLPKSTLTEVVKGNERIDRLVGDVKFDATPRNAAAIIAQLESSPYVEAISSIRLVRDTGGKVKVSLTVETWLRTREQGASS